MNYSPLGSSVRGILQTRILEWVAIPFSRDLHHLGIKPTSPALQAVSSLSLQHSEMAGQRMEESISHSLTQQQTQNVLFKIPAVK